MNKALYEYWKNKIVKFLKRRKKPISIDEFAKKLKVNKLTLYRWISILELKGVVSTEINNDRRKYVWLRK